MHSDFFFKHIWVISRFIASFWLNFAVSVRGDERKHDDGFINKHTSYQGVG